MKSTAVPFPLSRKKMVSPNQFLEKLIDLVSDCDRKSVSTVVYRSELVRDAFISGIQSSHKC